MARPALHSRELIDWRLLITQSRLESTLAWLDGPQGTSLCSNCLCMYRPDTRENYSDKLISLGPSILESVTHSSPQASLVNLYLSKVICALTLADFVYTYTKYLRKEWGLSKRMACKFNVTFEWYHTYSSTHVDIISEISHNTGITFPILVNLHICACFYLCH